MEGVTEEKLAVAKVLDLDRDRVTETKDNDN